MRYGPHGERKEVKKNRPCIPSSQEYNTMDPEPGLDLHVPHPTMQVSKQKEAKPEDEKKG